jgi:hypothetical protein
MVFTGKIGGIKMAKQEKLDREVAGDMVRS